MNELMFRTIVDTSLDAIGVSTVPALRFVYVNEAFETMIGLSRTEVVGRDSINELPLKLDRRMYDEFVSRLEKDGVIRDMELPVPVKRDGVERTVLISAVMVVQEGERYAIWMLRDITELKKTEATLRAEVVERTGTEQRLRESEGMVRKIIETSPDGVTIARTSDGTYREVNEAFLKLLGAQRSEVIGKSLQGLQLWQDRAQAREFMRRLRADSVIKNMEVALRRRDGILVPFLVSAVMTNLGSEECVVSIIHDITEIKETETKLRESEAMVRKIIETCPDSITIARTSDGTYLEVNEAFLKQFGFQRSEVIGKTVKDLPIWGERSQAIEVMRRLRADSLVKDFEISLHRKDGIVIPFLVSAVLTELGSEHCVVSIIHDITELKQTERALTAAREAAQAASQAKSEFLSSMSHEIRTPMNAILGMSELLAETALDAQQQKFLSVMQNNGNVLLELINDILDLAKIESGRLSLEQAAFQLDKLLDKVAESLAVRAHGKGLELIARAVPDTPLNLLGDPLRLRQILINLLGNAIKFTETGEIVLTVERDRESNESGRLHFSVSDTGIGIPQARLGQVFESFTQVDASTTRQYGGSGLGLAIVRRLVELMGGRLWVESEVGRGSTFHFTANLKLNDTERAEHAAARPAGVTLAGMRTLIVDDNATNRLLLREILTPLGARLGEAESGAEALAALERARDGGDPYHLMLLDCRMPHMDGIQVMEQLSEGAAQELVVLMLTSDDLRMNEPRARKIKLDAYIVKPVRKSELMEAIQTAITGQPHSVISEKSCGRALQAVPADEPSLNILLAEDSPDNRLLVQVFLRQTPYRLVEAENGEIAVRKFKQEAFDLVLMDIQMPIMDGLEATRAIREWEALHRLAATPVIALTASAFGEDVDKCFTAGATLHVPKPVRKAVLLGAIRDLAVDAQGSPHASALGDPPRLSTA